MMDIKDRVVEALNRRVRGIAFHEELQNLILVDGVAFGCTGLATWRGDDAESGEVYPTEVPASCDDPEVIAEAILRVLKDD